VNHGFFNYDSNRGNSDSQRFAGISSNFGLSLGYPLLQRRRLSLPVNLSVQNYFDHRLKFFFNSESLSLSLQYQPMDNYSARVGYSFSYSQTNSGPSSYGHSMSFDGSRSGRWPTQTALHYDFLRNTSLVTRLLDSARHTGRLSLSQSLPVVGGGLGFSYTYSQSNTVRRDQENTAHSLSLTYSRSILANLGGNLGYSFTLTDFSNPDAQGITRKNVFNGINAGLSYSVSPGFSLSASYSFQTSRTNLRAPTEALEDILTGQVISLNKYKKHLIGISASLSF
jgi:opacity protein-like surface antigen